jgi:hypothetical protein
MAIAETYTCACDGYTEYGWTIKESHDHDDAICDIVIGTVSYDIAEAAAQIEAGWKKTRQAAEAFAKEIGKK